MQAYRQAPSNVLDRQGDHAQDVFQRLAQSGILVRAFKDKPNWLRFGIPGGDPEVWDLLIERVRKLLPR